MPESSLLSHRSGPLAGFDGERFLGIQQGAAAIGQGMRPLLRRLLDGGMERIFFIGAGGARLLTLPAVALIRQASTFPVATCHPAEVVLAPPAGLDARALVVIPSLSGTTRESVALMAFLRGRGAITLALTGHGDTPLARQADHAFVNFAEEDSAPESFGLQTLALALALLAETGACTDHDALMAGLAALPGPLLAAKAAYDPEAAQLAARIGEEPFHILTGAGSAWPVAHHFGLSVLEPMQWIRTRPVHAADFFHGTLELVEPGVSVLIVKGEDAQRPLADRVERFARRYTDKVWVVDAARAALPGLPGPVRALASPLVLATLLERLAAHLAARREHPLAARRYYKRVEY